MQNVFLNLSRNSKENIMNGWLTRKKYALVIHPASTLSTERQKQRMLPIYSEIMK